MGWNSANPIFDAVADEFIEFVNTFSQSMISLNGAMEHATRTLSALIEALQYGDWDTEDESLEKYEEYPYIVEAFRLNGIPIGE